MKENLTSQVAQRIVEHIRERGLEAGAHLPAQELADLFKVSRAPVAAALRQLSQANVVRSEANKGFFVSRPIRHLTPADVTDPQEDEDDRLYLRIGEDYLAGRLPDKMSENELMRRYDLTRLHLQRLLSEVAKEGWIARLPGHGWAFNASLASGEAYIKAGRFCAAVASRAILEPGFVVDRPALDTMRRQQRALLEGEIFTLPRQRLFEIDNDFHETLVSWANNVFFLEAIRRFTRLRRLMEYRRHSRAKLTRRCEDSLEILDCLERGAFDEASTRLYEHIAGTWSLQTQGDDRDGLRDDRRSGVSTSASDESEARSLNPVYD